MTDSIQIRHLKRHLLLVIGLLSFLSAKSQPACTFIHYSTEEGLSQDAIMSMAQDSRGVLWLSTWDGINSFDGYDFKVYKAGQGNKIALSSNRVDILKVDSLDYVWLQTYDNHAYRFDPRTEEFERVPAEGEGSEMKCTDIRMLPDGRVWLFSSTGGAIRVKTDPKTHALTPRAYAMPGGGDYVACPQDVFCDRYNREWLLTDNGLLRFASDEEKPTAYFIKNKSDEDTQRQAFYAWAAGGDELFFASDKGRVWCYSLTNDAFRLWKLPVQDKVVAISAIDGIGLLMATERSGLLLCDAGTRKCEVFDKSNCPDFPSDAIHSLFVDSRQEAWLEMTEWGEVCHFDPAAKVLRKERMRTEPQGADRSYPEFHITEDKNGNLWVHPQGGGLAWYDREQKKLLPFYDDPGSPDWRFSNRLHSMYADRQGNLWLCTHSKGLEKVTFLNSRFSVYPRSEQSYDLNARAVRAFFEDDEGRVWMGKRDGKVEIYSYDFDYLGFLTEEGTIAKTGNPLLGVAYHIMQDSAGNIWIATKGGGIVLAEKAGTRFRITRFLYDEENIYSLSQNSVYWRYEDSRGRIWAATFGGGLNYIQKTPGGKYSFINARNRLKGYPNDKCYRVRHISSDGKGNIWVGTNDGVLCFREDFKDPESIVFHLYVRIPDDKDCLGHNNVYRILTTSAGEMYFATFGGGLNRLVSMNDAGEAKFQSYTREDGLPSNILLSLEEDHFGNLWISTENGLSKFILPDRRFENYNESDFAGKVRVEESASLKLGSGRLLFGTTGGVLYFEPEQIRKSVYVAPVILSNLRIFHQDILTGAEGSPLTRSLNSIDRLVLSHKENTITLSFAAVEMMHPENIRYAYYLEGFEKEWNFVDKQRTATYTNLPKGNYKFRIRSTNGDGVWVENERVLNITVQPTFRETPYALLIYFLAFVCVLFIGVYILFTIYRLKHEVSVEQQVSDIKLRFFTNISHELRTPLTLIAGPVEYVLQHKDLTNDEVRDQLRVVERNTNRMLRMVNQILDFQKIQKHKMKLRVEQIDIVPFVRQLMDNFQLLAEAHRIDFLFESEKSSLKMWVDVDKLEKIVFNLLSNAFKYTPQGKMITLFIHENENSVAIGVQDQGIGIPESKKGSLFIRFENLLDKNLFNQQSSGIGLSLVKELVELHHGTIRVDSKAGEGSCFTVELLKGKKHYTGENVEFILSDTVEVDEEEKQEDMPEAGAKMGEHKTMLLVEDNLELRFFLRSIFAPDFHVVEAVNGADGLEKALKFVPDIIISDIMMPEKDGIAMTQDLHAHMATSHIPIVLLTAKTDMESRLKSMELGADDYITKPFSATYLKARVENILVRRLKLQQLYRANLMRGHSASEETDDAASPEMTGQDRHFMERLTALMEKNMDNGDLIVDDLVHGLSMSRSVFFKKLKTLTGLAPIEFIKEMRVKRAARLIENGDYNMTQIAYMVGINDPRYFSKCFKQHFGMPPTEYKEKMRKKPSHG